ncbi:DUF423 domain-containing protein [Guptibacillus hwajinpoensis]|uniref:Uncharacterized membrane protein YgdD (TMEM256/DUF423 family) n=1 Tax=Guptibacillus hwajinpoensis TaxID=208199 RepID=A0ABU0JYU6_9BACL|nr:MULTISPECIES: DUF423 domain-containing protein [Alkalihalobacillus]MDP4551492.1 DUF423 domain-containing protein [Alkalihalobacillus macyae]MDQ0482268.1 uncharacterized membrane protein YgdD (TMEM256/DUF423 family) [Alkalihalobacillus hemicentroti]
MKLFLIIGAINAALAVGLGAFGAHGLESRLSERMLDTFKTGVQYHMYHALGLIGIALAADKLQSTGLIQWAGWFMFAGIVLFSGSLYVLSLSGIKILGAITPLGGVAFITAWILLIVAAFRG